MLHKEQDSQHKEQDSQHKQQYQGEIAEKILISTCSSWWRDTDGFEMPRCSHINPLLSEFNVDHTLSMSPELRASREVS